ncbi:MAG TPA: glycosyltransferase family 2 protein [Acidobacteriota bacterium]|jgi:hypothetical protein
MQVGISAVVTAWNNSLSVCRCLDSLRTAGIREVVLCDCGSEDDTVEIVAREYPGVPILSRDQKINFAQARNLGLAKTREPLVLFVDGDWIAGADCICELENKLLSCDRFAVAVPRFQNEDGTFQIGHNVRRFPSNRALCTELLLLHKLLPNNPATPHYRMMDFPHDRDCVVEHACGAFVLTRRDALVEIGGYDECYAPAWMEDVDLHRRLASRGWRTIFCADAAAIHTGRETSRHFIIEHRYHDFYRSVLRYCRIHLPDACQMVRISMAVGMLLRILFSYVFPGWLRPRLLRRYGIYNSDRAIQSYKQMYFQVLRLAIQGGRDVSPGKPSDAAVGVSGGKTRFAQQAASSHD